MSKRQPRAGNRKKEPQWRTVERVAGLIEKTLDPTAVVEHDVQLPDLATPGVKRQCDLVVVSGPEHRRTRTIVEVQRRGRRVELATFDAWVAKLRAVGAQHLVCVSARGYPTSVVSKAAQLGPTVRLATLREVERESAVLAGAFGSVQLRQTEPKGYPRIEFMLGPDAPDELPESGELRYDAPLFRVRSNEVLSLNQIAQRILDANRRFEGLDAGLHLIRVGPTEPLEYVPRRDLGPVRLNFDVNYDVHVQRLRLDALHYEQSDAPGLSIWALVGRAPKPGRGGEYEVHMTFRPGADGRLRPQAFHIEGLEVGDIVRAGFGNEELGPFLVAPKNGIA